MEFTMFYYNSIVNSQCSSVKPIIYFRPPSFGLNLDFDAGGGAGAALGEFNTPHSVIIHPVYMNECFPIENEDPSI